MPGRKTDEQLRAEISMHSKTARDLLGKSHEIHMQALQAEFTIEHIHIMQRVIEYQRMAIRETKVVSRLEKVLRNRQIKEIGEQRADLR